MHDDMQPDNMNQEPMGQEPIGTHGETDREGAMAKADLYKLANYSLKLFKKMRDEDQLEGWVQAKITKAADYIASVYHYLEYEMEFSDYGSKLDNSEMYNEDQKLELKNKLMEAKAKVAELKKLQATKVKEAFDEKSKVGDTFKTKTGVATKTDTGVIHKNTSYADDGEAEEKSGKGKKSHAKAQSAAEKKERAPALKQSKTGTWGMKDGAKFDNRKTNEGAKPDFADLDKDGDEKEPMKKAAKEAKKEKKVDEAKDKEPEGTYSKKRFETDSQRVARLAKEKMQAKKKAESEKVNEASDEKCNHTAKGEKCPVHGMKECSMYESGEPSAGMTKKEKSATVKAAKAGKDIGKPGKSFDKVAKAAGGGEKGKKIAAAAMWKNKAKSLKESLDAMSDIPVEEAAMDQMDSSLIALMQRAKEADPAGLEAAMKQGPEALTTFLQTILSKIEQKVDNPDAQPTGGTNATAPTASQQPATGTSEVPANTDPNQPVAEQVNESVEFNRMKEFLTRLNG